MGSAKSIDSIQHWTQSVNFLMYFTFTFDVHSVCVCVCELWLCNHNELGHFIQMSNHFYLLQLWIIKIHVATRYIWREICVFLHQISLMICFVIMTTEKKTLLITNSLCYSLHSPYTLLMFIQSTSFDVTSHTHCQWERLSHYASSSYSHTIKF